MNMLAMGMSVGKMVSSVAQSAGLRLSVTGAAVLDHAAPECESFDEREHGKNIMISASICRVMVHSETVIRRLTTALVSTTVNMQSVDICAR